jgi:chromosomal replication initiator protein
MIHQGTLEQSPAMLAQYKAKQERLARFAQAAVRHEDCQRQKVDAAQIKALETIIETPVEIEAAPEPLPEPQPYMLPLKIVTIQGAVAKEYNVTREILTGPDRRYNFVLPRQVAMYLSRKWTDLSLPHIGRRFGGRDHTTALHSFNKIARLIKIDLALAAAVARIEAELSDLTGMVLT